jgi:hypothetical protein
MRSLCRSLGGLAICAALVTAPTAASASAQAPATAKPADSWLTLSMLNSTGAAALGGAAVAAAQPDGPPPPQYAGRSTPPLPVIMVWLAVLGLDVYLLTKHGHSHPRPNSPA